ncbi:hypothetical protein [Burkholderia pyrrocinia]|uniref:hypothetical protein n=1 Tax=Burkholderia pyrrocinia TaxID=60550 RepID=UPI002AB0F0BD|nr:hypothetical protein [Burkholderia pyrrocinia]
MKFSANFSAHDAAMTFFSFVPHLHDPNAFQNRQRDRDISAHRHKGTVQKSTDA